MNNIVVKGKIEFISEDLKGYDRKFTATLTESPAFSYGNHTAIVITWENAANGYEFGSELFDTRYDKTIKRNECDFKTWVKNYFENNYCAHILTIY